MIYDLIEHKISVTGEISRSVALWSAGFSHTSPRQPHPNTHITAAITLTRSIVSPRLIASMTQT
jgi:hypothetical protein